MKGDGNFQWWCGDGAEPEVCRGPFGSRDEAIEDGREHDSEQGFTIYEADKAVLKFDIFDFESIAERIIDHNEQCWGEDQDLNGSAPPEAVKQLEDGLTHFLQLWWAVHKPIEPFTFGETRVEEYFEQEEGEVECLACGKDCKGACDQRYDDDRAARDEEDGL